MNERLRAKDCVGGLEVAIVQRVELGPAVFDDDKCNWHLLVKRTDDGGL